MNRLLIIMTVGAALLPVTKARSEVIQSAPVGPITQQSLDGHANVQYCSVAGCLPGPHLFGQLVTNMTTKLPSDDVNGGQEAGIAINVTSETGFLLPGGTLNNGKTGLSVAMRAKPGSGQTWGAAIDSVWESGVGNQGQFVVEIDTNNQNADCAVGVQNCASLFFNGTSNFPATAGIWMANGPQTATWSYHNGLFFQGSSLIKDNTIWDASDAGFTLNIQGTHANGDIFHHPVSAPYAELITGHITVAGISDSSDSPKAISLSGTHSIAAIEDSSTSPASLNIIGSHSLSGIREASTSGVGADFAGTYATAGVRVTASPPIGVSVTGSPTVASFSDGGNSPKSLNISGTHSVSSINDASTSPAALNLAGVYSLSAVNTANATTNNAFTAAAGQKICFNGTTVCFRYDGTAGKVYLTNASSANIMSIDMSGNAIFKGTVTPSGTP